MVWFTTTFLSFICLTNAQTKLIGDNTLFRWMTTYFSRFMKLLREGSAIRTLHQKYQQYCSKSCSKHLNETNLEYYCLGHEKSELSRRLISTRHKMNALIPDTCLDQARKPFERSSLVSQRYQVGDFNLPFFCTTRRIWYLAISSNKNVASLNQAT